jgi:protein involved in ribonucleotide reduction
MNTFGISVFSEPEEFIALYLGMKRQTGMFLEYIEKLLQRTKSPPIAITYTYHFLRDKTEEELSLDVIRFISQLADLSQGVSMSSSLKWILT